MRYRSLWRRVSSGACVLWLLAACGVPATGSSANPSNPPAATPGAAVTPPAITPDVSTDVGIEGTTWRLVAYGPMENPTAALPDPPVTATFEAGGKLAGSAGCNSYFATYKLDAQFFTTSDVGSTMMACLDDQRMQQESAYLTALQAVTALERSGDKLTIDYQGGQLQFTRVEPAAAEPLEGTVWQLDSFITGETARSTLEGTTSTAVFEAGKLSGMAGCNQFSADYSLTGEMLEVGEVVMTEMACDAAIMAQEQEFVNALQAASRLAIVGNELRLVHPGGTLVLRAGEQQSR